MNAVKTNNTIPKKWTSYGKKNLKNKISNNVNFENNLSPLITNHYSWVGTSRVELKSVNCNQGFIQPLNNLR